MKSKEELNALKAEVETLNKKLAELTEDELTQVTGGTDTYFFHIVKLDPDKLDLSIGVSKGVISQLIPPSSME
mgnify:CR=1 FL=1